MRLRPPSASTGLRWLRAPTFLLAALVACSGCARPPGTEEVAARFGPRDFGDESGMPRPPVVQLGSEARPVVRAPTRTVLAGDHGVLVGDDRTARVDFTVPAHMYDWPEGAFELEVFPVPFDVPLDDAGLRTFREKSRFERRESGWRLRRPGDGRAEIEIDVEDEKAKQLLSRVSAIGESPTRMESEPLELAAGQTLELGYGSLVEMAATTYAFRAALECDGKAAVLLFEDRVDAGDAARWRDATVPLGSDARGCRLVLEAARSDGRGVPGAVWAVPRVLARVGPDAEPPNIVLISLDTLRADHMSGLGYPRETTPVIDRELMGKGTTFVDATSVFGRTDIAHLSLMTSLYPNVHPVRGRLAPGSPIRMLAERLQDEGYETVAFGESGLFGGPYGFWHGFDRFIEFPLRSETRGVGVFERGVETLEALRRRRFFLTLHTYKTHDPWVFRDESATLWSETDSWSAGGPDARVPEKHRAKVDDYDRTIREVDAMVGGFLTALDESGLADRTVVVLVSDHGEAFGEHVVLSHGYGFHQEQLHVPIVFRGPGIPADTRIETPVSLVDVAPTLLDLAGGEPIDGAHGVSLTPAFAGASLPADRPLFFGWLPGEPYGFRRGDRKIARGKAAHTVYDLGKDPLEQRWPAPASVQDEEIDILDDYLSRGDAERTWTAENTVEAPLLAPISDETKKALKMLGYVE